MLLTIIIVILYAMYTCFESLGILSRAGGYSSSLLPIGISLQNQILSLNRFLGFLLPPMVGLFVDLGGGAYDVVVLGLVSSALSFSLIFVMFFRFSFFINCFDYSSRFLSENGYSLFRLIFSKNKKIKSHVYHADRIIAKFVIAQVLNTGLAMPSVFVINVLAIFNNNYSSSILQATTLLSGVGNLILNFYIIPNLAFAECQKNNNAVAIYKSIYIGKVIGLGFLGPFILALCGAFL